MVGSSLSQYKITAELGRGGMGIVYRATDTKLNRDVAIKVLPAAALASDDDRARFFREAQAAAQLSHPNVCHVYQVDEAVPIEDGKEPQPGAEKRLFIAMEFIEGETLQEYIQKGPLKLTEAVHLAAQVADALKAAHAKGIVHRDIKSANIMLTSEGIAKVLDFGLAKTNQSTMLTRMGSTLGTVNYMSPEQARGQEVDGRTDLYSLGTVLYEMIAGRLPFSGEYEQAVVYSILNENPEPLTSVRTGVPMQLEWIVNKLLSKEADYRYQTAADLLADLKTVDVSGSGHSRRSMSVAPGQMSGHTTGPMSGSMQGDLSGSTTGAGSDRDASKYSGRREKSFTTVPAVVWGILVIVGVAALAAGWFLKPAADAEPVRRFTFHKSDAVAIITPTSSPDGRYWAYAMSPDGTNSNRVIMLWDTETGTERSIPGSEQATNPRFSPDGTWIAMQSSIGGLMRARVPSGRTLFVDSLRNFAWLDNEHLVVGESSSLALYSISVEDQVKTPISIDPVDSTYDDFAWFQHLQDSPIVLMTAYRGADPDILAINTETGKVSVLLPGACCSIPVEDHTLLYTTPLNENVPGGQLIAQRLNPRSLRLSGAPVDVLADPVAGNQYGVGGGDAFFQAPNAFLSFSNESVLSWIDPVSGKMETLPYPSALYERFSFSPDGNQIAIERSAEEGINSGNNIFLIDLASQTEQRLTYTVKINRVPVWTRSGKIYFSGGPPQKSSIYVKNADGTGAETMLVEDGDFQTVSPDEKWLAYVQQRHAGDLMALNLETGDIVPIDTSAMRTNDPAISPNGKYIAFSGSPDTNNFVGPNQRLYVRSFPDPNRLYLQAVEGNADDPIWSPDGKFLYYRDQGDIYRIGVDTGDNFRPTSAPEKVASIPRAGNMRLAFHPGDGRMLAVFRKAALLGGETGGVDVEVIMSFSRYLDQMFGDEK